jgi:nicotinate dehydrogenase large molybdopterin subunit
VNPINEEKTIGGNALRIDAADKVTGQARYVEDIDMPGLLHAAVLRSPHHHAKLLSIDTSIASDLPGVESIITAADIQGENGFPGYSRDEPILTPVGDTLKMKGAPFALVIATTPVNAQKAMQAIKVEYEILAHTFDAAEALSDRGPQIYSGGNFLNSYQIRHGNLDAAFEHSDLIVETRYATAFQEHSALERESALGYFDEQSRLTVVGSTHEPHWQQGWIAKMLNVDLEEVRFISPPMGGSFGGKQDPWPNLAVGLAAYITGQAVRLVFSRVDSFDASPKRHPYTLNYKIGATKEGQLTGMRVRIDQNTGAYDADGYYIPEYAVVASGGAYRWQAVDNLARSIFTNAPKCGQFRGFGTPQSTFALECTLDEIIQALDEDPLEFRLKNIIDQDSQTFLGYPIAESLGYREVLEALAPRFQEFQAQAAHFNANGANTPYRKAVGVSGMWYRFGKSGSLRIEAQAELTREGDFILYCSAPDYGQGTGTAMAQMGAEVLGIARERLYLVNADTALTPDSGVQGASRATYWVGNAVCQVAKNLKSEIISCAAELLDCDPLELQLDDRQVINRADPSQAISLAEVAQGIEHMGKSRKVLGVFDPSPDFPEETRPRYTPHFATGAHLAEVLVDLQTGRVEVTRFVAVHDVGRVINRPGAEGQVEGSILMGIGSALYEEYIPDLTNGFVNYILPMVNEMPQMETILVEVPGFAGPFGAKGLGETAMLASTPAVINAVSRAIGTRIREIPATPERVMIAMNNS